MARTENGAEQRWTQICEEYAEAREAYRYAEEQKASAERAPQQYRAMGGRIYEANREYCERQIAYWTAYYEEARQRWLEASETYSRALAEKTETTENTEISETEIEKAVVEAVETEMATEVETEVATEEQTQAQKWEADPSTADAWQVVWEHVRAGRIGGLTQDWVYTDDAWLLAAEFATEILGEMDEPTAEWEDLVDRCLAEIGRLL